MEKVFLKITKAMASFSPKNFLDFPFQSGAGNGIPQLKLVLFWGRGEKSD